MGIVNAKDMISPWKYDKIPNAKERVKAELLTPENQALINKLKPQASVDETTRLKEQMNALLAETSGGRRKTRKGKSKKTRKTRGRRV
jgi:hypothetical protein